jgi:hypothetical protein
VTQEKLLIESGMQAEVDVLQTTLDNLLFLLGRRIDLSTPSEGYYWDNCREIVIAIKTQTNRLTDWVRP